MDVPSHSIIIEAVKNGQIYIHMLMYKIPPVYATLVMMLW